MMPPRRREILILALLFGALLLLLTGCGAFWRTEAKTETHSDKTTVTKETEKVSGTQAGQPVNYTRERYQEEVSKDVAHSEMTRDHSSPAVEGLGSILSNFRTGNPMVDTAIALAGTLLVGKGVKKAHEKYRGKAKP